MKQKYDGKVKRNEGKTKYGAKRERISTVRYNPQETSDEFFFEILGNM